ncbi:2516_t:CDS:1, partial [Paraglomus brasilianum]
QSKSISRRRNYKLIVGITELGREKDLLIYKNAKLLAKEAGLMVRIVELKENAENAKLRDAELNARIMELGKEMLIRNAQHITKIQSC